MKKYLVAAGVLTAAGYYLWSKRPNLNPADRENVVNKAVIDKVGEENYINASDKIFSALTFTPLGWLLADDAKKNYAKQVLFGPGDDSPGYQAAVENERIILQ